LSRRQNGDAGERFGPAEIQQKVDAFMVASADPTLNVRVQLSGDMIANLTHLLGMEFHVPAAGASAVVVLAFDFTWRNQIPAAKVVGDRRAHSVGWQ